MEDRELWTQDARVLANLGSVLLSHELPRVAVRIPGDLADLAVAAWEREDSQDGSAVGETVEQRQVRNRAAALALIGLSINTSGRREGDDVVVELSPELIGDAFRAADETPSVNGPDGFDAPFPRVMPRESLIAGARWLGVDVGGTRKGFDIALVDDHRLLTLAGGLSCEEVVELTEAERPTVVAIDSPRSCAVDGEATRDGERKLARTICGIRWTPDQKEIRRNSYYAWIVEGLDLFDALAALDCELIEVFPTASWTRWCGKRGKRSRSEWSRQGLVALGLDGAPRRTNQDQRDAIAAAVTARQHAKGMTESLGEIVVPMK